MCNRKWYIAVARVGVQVVEYLVREFYGNPRWIEDVSDQFDGPSHHIEALRWAFVALQVAPKLFLDGTCPRATIAIDVVAIVAFLIKAHETIPAIVFDEHTIGLHWSVPKDAFGALVRQQIASEAFIAQVTGHACVSRGVQRVVIFASQAGPVGCTGGALLGAWLAPFPLQLAALGPEPIVAHIDASSAIEHLCAVTTETGARFVTPLAWSFAGIASLGRHVGVGEEGALIDAGILCSGIDEVALVAELAPSECGIRTDGTVAHTLETFIAFR
jgi:hypothetical protein